MEFDLVQNYSNVRARVLSELEKSKRSGQTVSILPVSKGQPIEKIRDLLNFLQTQGQTKSQFGENYIEEILEKNSLLTEAERNQVEWVFLGRLQSRKIKKIVAHCAEAEGVSRLQEIEQIIEASESLGLVRPFRIKLQVNISGETQKGGFLPNEIASVLEAVKTHKSNKTLVNGLMGIASSLEIVGSEKVLEEFKALKQIRDQHLPGGKLSMGMSQDFDLAICAGTDQVRLGTQIFGSRLLK